MSDITISLPKEVNGHVICSTRIRHILAIRKSILMQIYMLFRQQAGISALRQELEVKNALPGHESPGHWSSNQSRFSQHGTHIFGEMLVTGSWSAQRVSNQCG